MALLEDLLPEMRPGLSQLPDLSLVSALRRAAQRFCRDSQVWEQDIEPFPMVEGRSDYELTPPDGARAEKIMAVRIGLQAVDRQMRLRELRMLEPFEGMPRAWSIYDSADGQRIGFDASPGADQVGLLVQILSSMAPTNDATEIPDWMATDWHDAIVSGARADLLAQRGTPQYDPDAAAAERYRYSMDAARAKRVQVSGRHGLMRAQPRRWV